MMSSSFKLSFLFLFSALLVGCQDVKKEKIELNVLPKVASADMGDGFYVVPSELRLATNTALLRQVAKTGGELLHEATGVTVKRSKENPNIKVRLIKDSRLNNEGYHLQVTSSGIVIEANKKEGILYGFQTLSQLMEKRDSSQVTIPCVNIADTPTFEYRCLDLDVCRHFYSIEDLKRIIKVMSHIKMNKLVLELSDNAGWRIEIKSYPELTKVAAWRPSVGYPSNQKYGINKDDGKKYGGYYKQSELRDLVRFAKKLNIEIIPQVEVSNHMKAAASAYPYLSCVNYDGLKDKDVKKSYPACMGNPEVLKFWDTVITELGHVFDSPFVHVGGGYMSAPYEQLCEGCHDHMKEHGFKSTDELQDHFMSDIEEVIYKHGKKLVGWNKIYRYSSNPNSMAMVWQSTGAGKQNILHKHPIIICPQRKYSLKISQTLDGYSKAKRGLLTLREVYEFAPNFDEKKNKVAAKYIKGVAALLWTNTSPDIDIVSYRLFPRLFAIAESGWSGYGDKDWNDFNSRQKLLIPYLKRNNLRYGHLAHKVEFRTKQQPNGKFALTLSNDADTQIRYTQDGKEPTVESTLYSKPIPIRGKMLIKACSFYKDGTRAKVYGKRLQEHKGLMAKTSFRYMYSSDQGIFRPDVLVDGIRNDFQTMEMENMDVTLDLGKRVEVFRINTDWLVRPNKSVFEPKSVKYLVSEDGISFKNIFHEIYPANGHKEFVQSVDCFPGGMKIRYIRIIGENRRNNPSWHKFSDRYAWLYLDEIVIE
ncbi:family 20 glycosylhydrolase [Halosquirtibacter xylanolyticus]|uniref:glycoside hydrolase family 20 protein n=1 Tax=Halosquirtibacter xylanolyticus TaxID=3374599 RepID=UPI00374A110C|nr:family 20 glycosylhydrolase [Prolixibacteraceae bacterium]